MKNTKAYGYNFETGNYLGEMYCQESPLEHGVFLIPANATLVSPPEYDPKESIPQWNGKAWNLQKIPSKIETSFAVLRRRRNEMLLECEWTQANDAELAPECIAQFKEYRRKLRHITDGLEDPTKVVWPMRPKEVKT